MIDQIQPMKALLRRIQELEKRQGRLRGLRRVRIVMCATVALAGLAQAAGIPVLESKLPVRVIDAKTGEALASTWVAAAESSYWTGFHASGTECFRAVVAFQDRATSDKPVVLPAASVNPLRWSPNTRHVELFAYRPGYCAARPYAPASTAGFLKWANQNNPGGLWGSVESLKAGESITIPMLPASDPPEHRLRHLKVVAREISGICYDQGPGYLAPLKAAMLVEATKLATTPLEKFIVKQIETSFDPASRSNMALWLPIHGVAESGDLDHLGMMLEKLRTDPTLRSEFKMPGNKVWLLVQSANYVSLGESLGLNDRDDAGWTPLMRAARAMQPAAVKMLLQEGADVNVLSGVGGYSALDLVLSRAAGDVRESGTEGQEMHMLRMIDLLAGARPAPTLHATYRAELADPAKWTTTTHLQEFWSKVRERVIRLRTRDAIKTTCFIEPVARRSLGLLAEGVAAEPGPR